MNISKKILPLGKEITLSQNQKINIKLQILNMYLKKVIKQVHNKYSLTEGISEKFIIKS